MGCRNPGGLGNKVAAAVEVAPFSVRRKTDVSMVAVAPVELAFVGIAQVMPHRCVRRLAGLVGIVVVVAEEDLDRG